MNLAEGRRLLHEIYETLPVVPCKGLCEETCGPVPLSALELAIIKDRFGGATPTRTDNDTDCPLLGDDGKCRAYADRPLICRAWGAIQGEWRCPHGCRADRGLTMMDISRLQEAVTAVGGEVRCLSPVLDDVFLSHGHQVGLALIRKALPNA